MEVERTLEDAKKIISLAKKEKWSEEELAKAVSLLHSQLEQLIQFF